MDILNFPGVSGLPSLLLTIFMLAIGGWYITKHAKSSAEIAAKNAQQSAIEAMQAELDVLREKIKDEKEENAQRILSLHRENTRLEHIIDTICLALKKQGIIITIAGEMIDIEVQDHKKITTVRIKEAKDATA